MVNNHEHQEQPQAIQRNEKPTGIGGDRPTAGGGTWSRSLRNVSPPKIAVNWHAKTSRLPGCRVVEHNACQTYMQSIHFQHVASHDPRFVWLGETAFIIQMKERTEAKDDPEAERRWFKSAVLNTAVRQIKDSPRFLRLGASSEC